MGPLLGWQRRHLQIGNENLQKMSDTRDCKNRQATLDNVMMLQQKGGADAMRTARKKQLPGCNVCTAPIGIRRLLLQQQPQQLQLLRPLFGRGSSEEASGVLRIHPLGNAHNLNDDRWCRNSSSGRRQRSIKNVDK